MYTGRNLLHILKKQPVLDGEGECVMVGLTRSAAAASGSQLTLNAFLNAGLLDKDVAIHVQDIHKSAVDALVDVTQRCK
jgi:hypothetical protein